MITIVGLGRSYFDITLCGMQAINKISCVIVKSKNSDTFKYFQLNNIKCSSLDKLINKSDSPDEFNHLAVDKLLSVHKKHGDVCFCVDGSGSDDEIVSLIISKGIDYTIINGVGYEQNILQHFYCNKYLSVNANCINSLNLNSNLDTIVTQINSKKLAAYVKNLLLTQYGDANAVVFNNLTLHNVTLDSLDSFLIYDNNTTLYLPKVNLVNKKKFGYNDLVEILDILRGDNGCKWDKAQTLKSLRPNVLEEAYEVIEAIDSNEDEKLIEELGDLLLQPMLLTKVANDCGKFNYSDVFTALLTKLIYRHSHIFGTDAADTEQQALANWDTNKSIEKKYDSISDTLDAVQIPSGLMRAYKVDKRAAKCGFDYVNINDSIAKVKEELTELIAEINSGDAGKIESELGDVLFSVVSLSRHLNIDSEVALNNTVNKFIKRFKFVEDNINKLGLQMNKNQLELMEKLWTDAKKLY